MRYCFFILFVLVAAVKLQAQSNPKTTAPRPKAGSNKTTTVETKKGAGWSASDKATFLENCIGNANMGEAKGTKYCTCMLQKIEKLYPNAADAAALDTAAIMTMARECLGLPKQTITTKKALWSKAEKDAYMKECVGPVTKKFGATKAKAYCSCTLEKVQKLYPNAANAGKLSENEMKQIAAECLDQ